jgi:hypothetical protein
MSTLRLVHRGRSYIQGPIDVPDGQHDWAVLVDNCLHCGNIYNVRKNTDRFCSPECQKAYHNTQRPRKTARKQKASG